MTPAAQPASDVEEELARGTGAQPPLALGAAGAGAQSAGPQGVGFSRVLACPGSRPRSDLFH